MRAMQRPPERPDPLARQRVERERLDPVFGGRSLAVELLLSLLLCSNL
jgi:hypothetical protein